MLPQDIECDVEGGGEDTKYSQSDLQSSIPGGSFGNCRLSSYQVRSEFGNKNSFAKKLERCEENSLPRAKNSQGFGKHFGEFAKGIDETCVRNFFNAVLTAVVVFLIVQFILFLRFVSNDQ